MELEEGPRKATGIAGCLHSWIESFWQIAIYLAPVVPEIAAKTSKLLNTEIESWEQSKTPLTGTAVSKFKHMLQRVNPEDIQKMIDETKEEFEAENAPDPGAAYNDSGEEIDNNPIADEIEIDDFVKVDLRVARIIQAEPRSRSKQAFEVDA